MACFVVKKSQFNTKASENLVFSISITLPKKQHLHTLSSINIVIDRLPWSTVHVRHRLRHRRNHPPFHSGSPSILREMGLWTLLEGLLLLANALAILNEDRFLVPKGWGLSDFSGGRTKSFKGQIIGLIYATQYLRVPLILFNSIFIIVKLVSGWCLARYWSFTSHLSCF